MNKDQTKSLILSVLKVAGGILMAHGATNAAQFVNSEDAVGLVLTLVAAVTSHFQHADTPVDAACADHGSTEKQPAVPAQPQKDPSNEKP